MKIDIDLETFYLDEEPEEEDIGYKHREHPDQGIQRQCGILSKEMEKWRYQAPCFGKYQWNTSNKVKISDRVFIASFCRTKGSSF
jgi:hypothetical protein